MGKRNASEAALEHSAAVVASPATPHNKRQRMQDTFDVKPSVTETPPQTYTLTKELVEDTVLLDLNLQKWRVGQPVGKGSFGEIFLASDDTSRPVTDRNAKYVVKIEPHSNGPLFVEIHCLMNTAKNTEESPLPDGMPEYIASGSHLFRNEKYRFLILPRFQYDLHSVLKLQPHKRLDQKNLLVLASQILDILQHLHDNGYVHSDIKAENLMVGNPADARRRRQLRDMALASTSSISSASSTMTLATKASTVKMDDLVAGNTPSSARKLAAAIEFSGSNPVRKCRFKSSMSHETSQSYNEMVSSHYLRPLKQINYFDDSEASSDAFGGASSRPPPPDVYNSNSNISVMSNGSSNFSVASSSGISSIAQNGVGSRRGAAAAAAGTTNGRRNARNVTNGGSKRGAHLKSTATNKRGKKAPNSRFRIISESNEEEEDEQERESENEHSEEERDRIYLIDFGLASKFLDTTGNHRPFFMDERRAHDGTLEFTSRDAHLGAHARRSDLECLGYNLICWSQGNLPWRNEKMLQQPEEVHHMKEFFMSNVKETLKLCYGPQVPKYLSVYMEYVNQLMYTDRPDYDYCRSIFRNEFKRLGFDLKTDFHMQLDKLRRGEIKLEMMIEPVPMQQPPQPVPVSVQKGQSSGKEGAVNGRARRTGRRTAASQVKEERDAVDGGGALEEAVTTTPQQQCNEQLLAKFGLMVPSMKDSSSKISPKNLRSKKAAPKKKRRKLSWEELLATDPEQIARQRIEKEFDEQDSNMELSFKYQGKPTYAILELENKLNSTLMNGEDASMVSGVNPLNESFYEVSPIKGYTKPMMDIVRRRHSNLIRSLTESQAGIEEDEDEEDEEEEGENEEDDEEEDVDRTLTVQNGMTAKRSPMMEKVPLATLNGAATPRRKAGLRPHVKPTSKSLFYHKNLFKHKLESDAKKKRLASTEEEKEEESEDEDAEKENESSEEPEDEEEEAEEKEEIIKAEKPKQQHQDKKRNSGGNRKRYEEDDDWDLDQAEPEIGEGNEVIGDVDSEVEQTTEEESENEEVEEDEEEESEEDEAMSESHSEESNSCDRDLGSKRNTRLRRWNGGAAAGAGNGRRLDNIAASNRFTESGKGQRMITRG